MELTQTNKSLLALQRWTSFLNLPWFGPLFVFFMRDIMRYRCTGKKEFRKKAATLLKEHRGKPIVVCCNHLTMIDSCILGWLLADLKRYFVHFNWLPWNVPEKSNFARNILLRAMCYLGKCVYVERKGSIESKRLTVAKIKHLVNKGELVNIFPEGGRSRTGKIDPDTVVYGIGEIVRDIPDCHVVCVYLRGKSQDQYSFFPRRNEDFHADIEVFKPTTALKGIRGSKYLTLQVIDKLLAMEDEYFASR